MLIGLLVTGLVMSATVGFADAARKHTALQTLNGTFGLSAAPKPACEAPDCRIMHMQPSWLTTQVAEVGATGWQCTRMCCQQSHCPASCSVYLDTGTREHSTAHKQLNANASLHHAGTHSDAIYCAAFDELATHAAAVHQ